MTFLPQGLRRSYPLLPEVEGEITGQMGSMGGGEIVDHNISLLQQLLSLFPHFVKLHKDLTLFIWSSIYLFLICCLQIDMYILVWIALREHFH